MNSMQEANEVVNVHVLIAERVYPLKVSKSEEEKVHSAVKLVNERIKEYQQLYDGKDKQDYMAMCLLNMAVEQMNLRSESQESSRILEEKLAELEKALTGISQ
jgi:cell division protein ZapA